MSSSNPLKQPDIKTTLHTIIFHSDTPAGKWFDIALIISILASVAIVMLDSVASIYQKFGIFLLTLEWVFTVLFTIEYVLRVYCSPSRRKYVFSFFGIIDVMSVLPTYTSLIFPSTRYLSIVRILRVLRVFRILKLVNYVGEASQLSQAMIASRRKITVFIMVVLTLVTVLGSIMYLVEGPENGFTSIPMAVYWAIVTLTTVGYGDILPSTVLGKSIASVVMLMGYGIIAVPTGIVTAELTRASDYKKDK